MRQVFTLEDRRKRNYVGWAKFPKQQIYMFLLSSKVNTCLIFWLTLHEKLLENTRYVLGQLNSSLMSSRT
jgi:hypothetical protein